MRVHVKPAADIQNSPRAHQSSHGARMFRIFQRARHNEVSIDCVAPRRAPLADSAPITKAMPKHKSNERVVDFLNKPPEPIEPEWLKCVDGRTSNQCSAAAEILTEPAQDFLRYFDIDLSILIECKSRIDPVAVRLVPDAPVPLTNGFTGPLFNAIPDELSTSTREPTHSCGVIKRWPKSCECDHWCCASIERGLHISGETWPVPDRIGCVSVECVNPKNLRINCAKAIPNLLATWAERELTPTERLIDTVAKAAPPRHSRRDRAQAGKLL